MKKINAPVNPFHPGEMLLEEFIEPNEWTQAYLAELLGTTAKLWMNLQATFDLDQAKKKRKAA